jgi:retinol-binding protein 3
MLLTSLFLAVVSTGATAEPPATGLDATTRGHVVDALLARLEQGYVFPDVARQVAASVRAKQAQGDYDAIADPEAFAKRLNDDVGAVARDGHLRVFYSREVLPPNDEGQKPSPEEIARERERLRRENFGFERVEWLPGNIGYLELRYFAWANAVGDRIAGAMAFLADTDALVIDLRRNGGALDPSSIALLCAYLLPERTLVNELHWREGGKTRVEQSWTPGFVPGARYVGKPVYLLTSRRTFSGAEEFAYDLQVLKRATLVGQTTGGGANGGGDERLDDHFGVFLPTGRAVNPVTGTNWEGVGVKPEIETSAVKALVVARQTALSRLVAAAGPDDPRQEAWRSALLGCEAELARFRPVEFRLAGHPDARGVSLAGDFNGWDPRALPMRRQGDAWVGSVDLEPGRYAYKFVVDEEWIADPANPQTVRDGLHTNSLRVVSPGEPALTHGEAPRAAEGGSR